MTRYPSPTRALHQLGRSLRQVARDIIAGIRHAPRGARSVLAEIDAGILNARWP